MSVKVTMSDGIQEDTTVEFDNFPKAWDGVRGAIQNAKDLNDFLGFPTESEDKALATLADMDKSEPAEVEFTNADGFTMTVTVAAV